jgi:hypothetical protein
MKIELEGDALKLFEDFLKYANMNSEEMADLMYYDHDSFKLRLRVLRKMYDEQCE